MVRQPRGWIKSHWSQRGAGMVAVMLTWLNGPFGVGKTAAAVELNRRLPGSAVCDPEHVGMGIRRMLPMTLVTPGYFVADLK